MNYSKLNELAAKVMGWTDRVELNGSFTAWWSGENGQNRKKEDWNPSICADDALILLEKIAGNEGIMLHKLKKRYGNWVCWLKSGANCRAFYEAKSAPLAMTLCALRAADIPESEITAAME